MIKPDRDLLTSSHWGTYRVEVQDGRVTGMRPFERDPDPSPIGPALVDLLDDPMRIKAPMVRKSWLEGGPGTAGHMRGQEAFVQVTWEEANRLVADELQRVRREHGNQAIYAGSYGWASAGRFHHAQSQLKRFLNCIGGYTSSRFTYSFAAAETIVPRILGTFRGFLNNQTSWESIATDCDLLVAFGGIPLKNGQISQGGLGAHIQRDGVLRAKAAGVEFVNISPLRSDIDAAIGAEWLAPRPCTDVALILALCHTLLVEDLCDDEFLARYTVGMEQFSAYLLGCSDGVEKTPQWAAAITEIPAETILELARRMAQSRTMVSVAWALTRQQHGEQPFWAVIALASMLGQIGRPGTGFAFGYSAMNNTGLNRQQVNYASLPQGKNPVAEFIPVARVTEMLERPGDAFDFDGTRYTYPDIRVVWWAGGNPFHHHQDLNRFRRAWAKPDTVIANDWCWNSLTKHADIVLPCTTTLERADLALTPKDRHQVVMDKAMEPVGQARDDHEIFRGIAARLGAEEAFTEGRSPEEWLRWIYTVSRQRAAAEGVEMPDWDQFQRDGWMEVPAPPKLTVMMEAFIADPDAHPLATPSGRIEIFSETIAGFGYDDCPGHPAWMAPAEWLGAAAPDELHLMSNQPHNKLHGQMDHGRVSQADRPDGLEPALMNPRDARTRDLSEGQPIRLHNARGACLATLRLSEAIRPGVVQVATGAWWDPDPDGDLCRHGNPNALTPDQGTSKLAQGPAAHSCLVRVEAFEGRLPERRAHQPPEIVPRG
ncbi:molybdopterin-dependent oxidoreductase [Candidatus Rhodobacter oscarellae]|nr:molybdopterin-dependent oxidoreductase [Candidatus Rhodobacter lobularis]